MFTETGPDKSGCGCMPQFGFGLISVGAVIRDHSGTVVGAKACVLSPPGSVNNAKLLAIRLRLDFCLNRELTNVCLFSDSLVAVNAVTQFEDEIGPDGALLLDISELLKGPEFLSINHMRRTTNEAAHHLARFSLQ